MTASCAFCRIARGDDPNVLVVYEDASTVAFVPLNPATRGHILVIPRTHVWRVWDLDERDADTLARATVRMSRAIVDALDPPAMNVIQSNGVLATQTVNHVHVHLVPRWPRDRLRLKWPRSAAESVLAQRRTAHALMAAAKACADESEPDAAPFPGVTPEDRRQHLSFIQAVVSRMATASASAKTWLLPIVTATYGYALVSDDWYVAVLGIFAALVFGLLDANYLKQERAFRSLYDDVAAGADIRPFGMTPALAGPEGKADYWPNRKDWTSWSIALVYLPIILAGGVIIALVFQRI